MDVLLSNLIYQVGQLDVVLRDVVIAISGLLEVLARSVMLNYLWVQPWILLNNIR